MNKDNWFVVGMVCIGWLAFAFFGSDKVVENVLVKEAVASGYDKKHQPKRTLQVDSQATTLLRAIRWDGGTSEIWIQNRDATNDLLISFDTSNDKTFWTIPANTNTIDVFPVGVNKFWAKSSAGTINFEAIIYLRAN
jgi:hypothetical protein